MRQRLVALVFVLSMGFAAQSFAQTTCTTNCSVSRNQTFSIAADHTGIDAEGYRLYQNGVVVRDVPVTALVLPGTITFVFQTGLAATGTYTFAVSAYNNDDPGNETLSAPITLVVKRGKPGAPSNVRVVK